MTGFPDWFSRAFSPVRLAPYLAAAHGDASAAERLYWWNVEISGAFYGPLHCLEVCLRNALHTELTVRYGRADWWAVAPLDTSGGRVVAEAQRSARRRRSDAWSADDVVAHLSFGFWVSLVSKGTGYDRHFWVPTLHRAFPGYSGPRRRLHERLYTMLLLRNRIMHHEPIHHRDLLADHRTLCEILGFLNPDCGKTSQELDRVQAVLARRDDVRVGQQPPRF